MAGGRWRGGVAVSEHDNNFLGIRILCKAMCASICAVSPFAPYILLTYTRWDQMEGSSPELHDQTTPGFCSL